MGEAWGFLLWIPILYGAYLFWKRFEKRAAIKAAAPQFAKQEPYEKGPMKVDIAFQEIPAKNVKHRLHGGDHWWRMHMDIWFSKEDWALFERSGLIEHELFSYPHEEFPDKQVSFTGYQLRYMPNHRDFPNIQEAEGAKEELISGLHAIRTRIDGMKSSSGGGPERERIEI